METLNSPGKVVISQHAYEFDGHPHAFSVTERDTGRLIGHVARTRNAAYGRKFGTWCYLGVTEERGMWTLGGWTRADAVDHLQSWWCPSGPFIGGVIS